jgi:hypothetical protein
MKANHQTLCRIAALGVALALTACAAPAPKPLYQWANYQAPLYQYFKTNGANPGEQIAVLEEQVQKNRARGEKSPPGLHGHLALLYSKLGNEQAARLNLEAERTLFPESAAYVDFLLNNSRTPAPKS